MRSEALVLLGSILFAAGALAAPDEAALGKAEGYPVCPRSLAPPTRCLVGLVSHYDEVFDARKVTRGEHTRPLKRAAPEAAINYTYQSRASGLDDYLSRHRTTGLLILKGDTIVAERYQYERTPEQRMASFSMAKTIVAMLVGIALSEGKIRSLDDRAQDYVTELKGTPYGETPLRHLLTMSSGVRFTETYSGSDDIATLSRLSTHRQSDGGAATVLPFRTRDRAPGEKFHYSSAETQVLGLVLRAATGKPLAEYLSDRIWQPMGAEADASWVIDKGGYEVAIGRLQRHAAGLRAIRHAARERRHARRPGNHPRSLGARRDHAAGEAVPARGNELLLRLRIPDLDHSRKGALVRAAGTEGTERVRGPEVEGRDGAHRGGRDRRRGNGGTARTLVRCLENALPVRRIDRIRGTH